MPQLIKSIDELFKERQKDLFVLKFFNQKHTFSGIYREDDEDNIKIREDHMRWFDENGIRYELTCPASLLCGWNGEYCVEFDDASLKKYCEQFETPGGKSVQPDKFQMYSLCYKNWSENFNEDDCDCL